jgi:hypothetical protein
VPVGPGERFGQVFWCYRVVHRNAPLGILRGARLSRLAPRIATIVPMNRAWKSGDSFSVAMCENAQQAIHRPQTAQRDGQGAV